MIALAVVSVALCLLLVSVSESTSSYSDTREAIAMKEEAERLLERILAHPDLTWEGEYLLLDWAALHNTTIEDMVGITGTSYEFRFVILDTRDMSVLIFETELPRGRILGLTTSCNIWVGQDDMSAARVSILIWR